MLTLPVNLRGYVGCVVAVINAERAAYRGPDFAPKIARTRKALLREVAQRFIDG